MRSNELIIYIALIVIIILVVIYFIVRFDRRVRECTSDKDCIHQIVGKSAVCQETKCVECAFDSDCCGGQVCVENKCIIISIIEK